MKNLKALMLLGAVLFCTSFIFSHKKKTPLSFKTKSIEKSLGKVSEKLYASKYEVNNLFYREFLAALQTEGKSEQYEIARIRNENWIIGKDHRPSEPFIQTYHIHPAYDDYPVVNINQEGARLFCDWLTKKYNETSKRKFHKVQFRLPTETEWKTAARANHKNAPFPWGGYYLRNSKGQFLANFRRIPQTMIKYDATTESVVLDDKTLFGSVSSGPHIPSPVESFFPNDFGLYHMSGNAAEMLSEEGRTKGGSWSSSGYYIQIDADDEFEGFTEASPSIGFRYFMEVLEE